MATTLHIRPSTISSMMLCPARQILKSDEKVTAEPLVFGTLVHWRIEQHLLFPGFSLSFDEVLAALETIYREDTDGGSLRDVASNRKIRELINEAMVAFDAWIVEVEPNLPSATIQETPVLERTLTARIWVDGDSWIELTGTPDAVFVESGLIVDWKTAGRNWNADKAQSQIQPWAYSLMAKSEGWDIRRFEFWVYDRSTESWWLHVHHLDDVEKAHEALTHQAAAFALMIDADVPVYTPSGSGFKARGWHCSPQYCDLWGVCTGKYLVADGRANEPALDNKQKGWT